jgi:two-component system, OmpR family, response regulator
MHMSSLLLVEDDERVQRFIVRGLESEGHAVAIASDGTRGLAVARSGGFDALILDMMLPHLSGKDICQRLRALGVATPILMLTALDAVEDKVDCLRSGADDYLTKPFDFDELLARIEALIRRSRGIAPENAQPMRVGSVTLDRESRTVRREGRVVELTAKEFQLLDLLMSSTGKVLSRTRILSKVWNYDNDPLTNVVDVYMRRLRAKLHWDSEHGPLRTLRGYGYRLDADVS